MKKIFYILLAMFFAVEAMAQGPHFLKGKVSDPSGEPVVGAYIYNTVTATAAVTDLSGAYELQAATGQVLRISCMGYAEKEIPAPSSSVLNIVLEEDNQMLEETVVVGYGTQKKINLTGAVSVVTDEQLKDRPTTNGLRALQGVDPSLNVIIGSGNPTEGQNINVRGVPSVNSSSPLVLIDGIPGGQIHQLNSNDIESISILKDASAAAIYGAKASAGVILITTKSGKSGDAKVNYSFNGGITTPTTPANFITNGYEYVTLINPLYRARYNYDFFQTGVYDTVVAETFARKDDVTENPERPWVTIDDDGNYHYYGNFDWYHNIFNTARRHSEHNISISGGTDKVKYYISGRYYDQEGTLSGPMVGTKENYDSYAFRAKVDAQILKWARWTVNGAFNSNNQVYPGITNEALTIAGLDQNLVPVFTPTNPDGSYVMLPKDLRNVNLGTGRTVEIQNPQNHHKISANRITLSNNLHLTPLKGLSFDADYNVNFYHRLYNDRSVEDTYSNAIGSFASTNRYSTDSYRERIYDYVIQSIDAYFTYETALGEAHHLKATGGVNYETYRLVDNTILLTGVGSADLSTFNSVTDDSIFTVTQDISAYKTLGFFGRLNYDYKERYLLELSGRYDGSSRFQGAGNIWGFFPSASFGWRFTEEPFMEGVRSWWTSGKVRFSAGSLGNQQVTPYQFMETIDAAQVKYIFNDTALPQGTSVSAPNSSDLTWETVTTYNAGLDLSFLSGKLSFTGDAFIRDTKGMLTSGEPVPSTYGASAPKSNSTDLRTTGYELMLTWKDTRNLLGSPFFYSITGTLGDYVRKITHLSYSDRRFANNYEGKVLGEIWGYHVPGLFRTDEEAAMYQEAVHNAANVYQRVYNMQNGGYLMAGDVKFDDRNGDGYINNGSGTVEDPGDMMVIGNTTPRYNYGLRLDANWKGFDVSIFFQGVGKRDWYPASNSDAIYGANLFWQLFTYPIPSFVESDYIDRCWSEDNPNAYFPRPRVITCYNGGPLGQNNDRYLQNAAYLRFKNLTIGYTVPALKKAFSKIRVYVSGENLYYWSPMKKNTRVIDPELAVSTTTYKSGSGSGYQMPRTLCLGVDVTF